MAVVQVVECPPSKPQTQSSSSSNAPPKKERNSNTLEWISFNHKR
jgi:hypothetical protein